MAACHLEKPSDYSVSAYWKSQDLVLSLPAYFLGPYRALYWSSLNLCSWDDGDLSSNVLLSHRLQAFLRDPRKEI